MMRIMLVALLVSLPGAALAQQQWTEYATDVEGAVSAYDTASLERSGNVVNVSIRRDFSRVPNMPQRTAVERWRYDCAKAIAGWISFTTWNAAGEVMEQRSHPAAEVSMAPLQRGSTGYTLFERICGTRT
jgi:hypothetical protein